MRVLFASTQGAGHFHPLVPFVDACLRRGHEVLVAGPPTLAPTVERAGYPFWEFDAPPEDEVRGVWSWMPSLSQQEQNVVVVREIFARLDATASLPRLREACKEWRPDVVLREPNEYGSALAAELAGIPHARVAIGLSRMEVLGLLIAAPTLDGLRLSLGLAPDPAGETIRRSPYLTVFPPSFEDPREPPLPNTFRCRDPAWDRPAAALPEWWGDGDAPLVYVTFGSVAGGMEMTAHVFAVALDAVAELPVRVLLTVGHGADLDALPPLPANVHVERWVSQADVLARATAVVGHGGSGTTLGTLAAGLPQVVVPLFADQPFNAERVEALGAGLTVQPPDAAAIRDALRRVLADGSFRAAAERLAAELRSQAPTDAALDVLAREVVQSR
jgi:UDP:flavonoid glycosyltransferase YjiC (YdhE family)